MGDISGDAGDEGGQGSEDPHEDCIQWADNELNSLDLGILIVRQHL